MRQTSRLRAVAATFILAAAAAAQAAPTYAYQPLSVKGAVTACDIAVYAHFLAQPLAHGFVEERAERAADRQERGRAQHAERLGPEATRLGEPR